MVKIDPVDNQPSRKTSPTQNHKHEKMAASSIANKLFDLLSAYNYTTDVTHLTNRDVLAQKVFPHTPLSHTYWLDTHRCYTQCKKNSQQLFELFGAFNDESAKTVRSAMITHINAEKEFYSHVSGQHLKKLKLSIEEWLNLMCSDSVFADELMLYTLARTYQ